MYLDVQRTSMFGGPMRTRSKGSDLFRPALKYQRFWASVDPDRQ